MLKHWQAQWGCFSHFWCSPKGCTTHLTLFKASNIASRYLLKIYGEKFILYPNSSTLVPKTTHIVLFLDMYQNDSLIIKSHSFCTFANYIFSWWTCQTLPLSLYQVALIVVGPLHYLEWWIKDLPHGGARIYHLFFTLSFQMLRACCSHDVTIETNICKLG